MSACRRSRVRPLIGTLPGTSACAGDSAEEDVAHSNRVTRWIQM